MTLPRSKTIWLLRCVAFVALIAMVGCSAPIRTQFDTDPSVSFARYSSFAWIGSDPLIEPTIGKGRTLYASSIDDKRIRAAIDSKLQSLGYSRVSSFDAADLIVTYSIGTEEKVRYTQDPMVNVYYPRYGYGPWYGGSAVRAQSYTEGTLMIQFFDQRTKRAVWVGWGSKRLSTSDEPADLIPRAVNAILKPFPPRA